MKEALNIPASFLLGPALACEEFQSKYLRYVFPNAHTSHRFDFALGHKLRVQATLFTFYEHRQFIMDRAYTFAGKQKTEAALVKSFTE